MSRILRSQTSNDTAAPTSRPARGTPEHSTPLSRRAARPKRPDCRRGWGASGERRRPGGLRIQRGKGVPSQQPARRGRLSPQLALKQRRPKTSVPRPGMLPPPPPPDPHTHRRAGWQRRPRACGYSKGAHLEAGSSPGCRLSVSAGCGASRPQSSRIRGGRRTGGGPAPALRDSDGQCIQLEFAASANISIAPLEFH